MTSISGVVSGTAKDLGRRLRIVSILPATSFAVITVALILAGAPGSAPSWEQLRSVWNDIGFGGLALLGLAITALSIAFQPFEISIIRLLEGYWPVKGIFNRLTDDAVWIQRRRWWGLCHADATGASSREAQAAGPALARFPKEEHALLPTALGNTLRAMERRAGSAYAMEAVQSFPRLYYALPSHAVALLTDLRDQLDASVRFCVLSLLTSGATLVLLVWHGWWLLVPGSLVLVAYLSYRACLVAANNYGVAVEAAFDVYHLRLLDEMGIKRPSNTEHARSLHRSAGQLMDGTRTASVPYTDTPIPSMSPPGSPAASPPNNK